MKAVIFGAGASYDSIFKYTQNPNESRLKDGLSYNYYESYFNDIGDYQFKPPLANSLFIQREEYKGILERYPGVKSIAHEANLRPDIEKYFDELNEHADKNRDEITLSNLLQVQFYLQEFFYFVSENYSKVGFSNYEVLLRKAHRYSIAKEEPVIFISFNYDTLLEKAFESALGTTIRSINDYTNNDIRIYKPHGSCNWQLPVNNIFSGTSNLSFNLAEYLRNNVSYYKEFLKSVDENKIEIGIWSDRQKVVPSNTGELKYQLNLPRIAIPLTKKDNFLLTKSHESTMKKDLSQINEILIVGWRATEKNFLNFLKTTIGTREIAISIVDPDPNVCLNNLKNILPNIKFNVFNKLIAYRTNENSSYVRHFSGSFSAYTMYTTEKPIDSNPFLDFFELK